MDKIEQPTGPTTTFRKPRVRRRWPWIVGGVIALLAVLAAVFYFAGRPLIIRIAKGELDRRLAEVSEAIGRKVVVSGLAPTLTEEIVLERVQIPGISEGPPTLIIPRVRFDFSLWDALLGRRAPNRVVIEGLRLNVTMEGAASADLTDLLHGLQRYREHHKSQSGGSGGGGRFPEIEVRNATILVLQAGTTGAAGTLRELNIEIRRGGGAYICGEETALFNSIEGKRGEARFRPPFPPISGLFGKPTIINNVETLMNIPPIIAHGGAWFSGIGTAKSTGTKVFSVSGDVERPGVYEYPFSG